MEAGRIERWRVQAGKDEIGCLPLVGKEELRSEEETNLPVKE
jgi:hypothetical protein